MYHQKDENLTKVQQMFQLYRLKTRMDLFKTASSFLSEGKMKNGQTAT